MVTDSAANLPPELAASLAIAVAPLELRFGDESFRDGVDMVGADFYERLVRTAEPASTAAPSPGAYLEAFRASGHDEVLCVTVAARVSAAFQQARLAADRFEGRVEVLDSGSATVGQGFVALEAARAARDGASLEDARERAATVASDVTVFGAIETFEFLQRSGRVGKLQAFAATQLDLKPVFRLDRGEIRPVARPRTMRRALARIAEDAVREIAGRRAHVAAFHARAEERARELLDRVCRQAEVVEELVVECTPAIGAHTGPGLVGLGFYCE